MELCLYQTPYHGCVYGWRGWTMHLEENIPFVCEKLKKKKKKHATMRVEFLIQYGHEEVHESTWTFEK